MSIARLVYMPNPIPLWLYGAPLVSWNPSRMRRSQLANQAALNPEPLNLANDLSFEVSW
jgi:hypothetical protein